jgi:predicted ATPase/DNA-binding winged helix-turn-helix (wHTH) protein
MTARGDLRIDAAAHHGYSVGMQAEHPVSTRRVVSFGPFRLLPEERLLETAAGPVQLGSRALEILITLVEHAGEVVSKQELMARAWPNVTVDEAGLRVHVSALRKALGDGRGGVRYITNVVGRGYSFVAPVVRASAPGAAAPVQALGRTHNLPPSITRVIGRDDAARSITTRLTAQRLVSIIGPGGIGKTTVALLVAHALLSEFNGAVFFMDMSSLSDPAQVPTTVASTLGVTPQSNDPLASLIAYLHGQHCLLVLDSCEHLIDAVAAFVERLSAKALHVHILVTSREALRVLGEHVYRLLPLGCPPDDESLTAAEILAFPAAQLFVENAAATGTSAEISDADARIVGDICRRLDGVALAIELVASRTEAYGLHGILNLLDSRFRLLLEGRRTAVQRHQTLHALLDWSYNLLTGYEQLIVRQLSIFVGTFTLDAAQAVATDGEKDDASFIAALSSLIAKSLVASVTTASLPRFRLLDTTRAYAFAKLGDSVDMPVIARRHANYFQSVLQQWHPAAGSAVDFDGLAHLPSLLGNVRAALEWSFADDEHPSLRVKLCVAAAPLFLDLSLLAECYLWSERAIALLDDAARGTRLEMELQQALAISAMFTKGNGDDVLAAIKRGLELAEDLADADGQMQMYSGLNIFLTRIGDFRGSLEVGERCMEVARATNDPSSLLLAEWMLGVSHHLVGNQAEARQYCASSLAGAPTADAKAVSFFGYDHRVRALVALARALWLVGLPQQATNAAHQTIDAADNLGQPVTTCISLIYAAPVFIWCGAWPDAEKAIDRLIEHATRHSLAPYLAVGNALKGELMVRNGAVEAGADALKTALQMLRAERHDILVTVFARALAEALSMTGQSAEALAIIDDAIARAERAGGSFDQPELYRVKAQILTMSPADPAEAEALLLRALAIARQQSATSWELRAAMALARLRADHGTRDMLTEIYHRFTEGLSTPDLVEAAQLL